MLVPEGRHEVTTEGGLDIAGQEAQESVLRSSSSVMRASFAVSLSMRSSGAGRSGSKNRREGLRNSHRTRMRMPSMKKVAMPRAQRWSSELDKDSRCGKSDSAISDMRFNAGHALNYANVKPVAVNPRHTRIAYWSCHHQSRRICRLARCGGRDEAPDGRGCGQMIYGVGTDLVSVKRIEDAHCSVTAIASCIGYCRRWKLPNMPAPISLHVSWPSDLPPRRLFPKRGERVLVPR